MAPPLPTVSIQGQGAVPADLLNTYVQGGMTYAVMRTLTGVSGMTLFAVGGSTPNDGGQGSFYWNATSTTADNGFSVIVPNGATIGAWIRILPSAPIVQNFGLGLGTFTPSLGVLYFRIQILGGGGGGSGGGQGSPPFSGTAGASSTFSGGTLSITAQGGGINGAIAAAVVLSGTIQSIINVNGGVGGPPIYGGGSTVVIAKGGDGAGSFFGDGAKGGGYISGSATNGANASVNGVGGGGGTLGSSGATGTNGWGGNAGAYYEGLVSAPFQSSYSYTVGAGGAGGAAGTNGTSGGFGGGGDLVITEYFQ